MTPAQSFLGFEQSTQDAELAAASRREAEQAADKAEAERIKAEMENVKAAEARNVGRSPAQSQVASGPKADRVFGRMSGEPVDLVGAA